MSPEIPVTDVRSDAMRLLSNGVYVLTACLSDTVHAATVSWISQVSFQPPLVMVALQRNSHLAHAVRKAHRFAINILGADQQALAEKFFAHTDRTGRGAGARRPSPARGRGPLPPDHRCDGLVGMPLGRRAAEPRRSQHPVGRSDRRRHPPSGRTHRTLGDAVVLWGVERIMTITDFRSEAEALRSQLIAWRRDLHQHPELGFEVRRTAGIVAQTLGELGYEVRTGVGRTGVVALLHGGRPGPTVMLRADMDALPIQEISDAPYVSQVPGMMHACGHDGHVAIGLGTAALLARHAAELPGRVLFVFQPAEEGQGGAAAMVADGALADPVPDAAFGLHLWNTMPMGRVVAQAGPLMAAADTLRIIVRGRGGHGALPHETVDAVAVTGQVLSALQTIVSRNVDPQETAVLTIGTVHGGTAFNVIAETVEMQGTIRTFSPAVRETVLTRLRVLLDGVTAGLGATYELDVQEMTGAVVNDAGVAEIARAAAVQVVGNTAVSWHAPLMVSEDFSEFARRVPACFMLIGSGNAELGLNAPHHNPRFDFDERVLPIGVALLATTAVRFLEGT